MTNNWKAVSVFISSTFRDMHAERDHLVKVVFPALREKLEAHRIYLIDIDLRWGVTAEQAENDQVLELCLDKIDDCRPYFIGILGERYGWVPQQLPPVALKRFPWIVPTENKSVTELEMLHGVLRNPQMQGHGFFYFRDPQALVSVPDAVRADYVETNPDRVAALQQLKATIRQSGFPYRENYPARWDATATALPTYAHGRLVGLDEFGQRVHDDLWTAIQQQEQLDRPRPILDREVEEADYHKRFAEMRTRVYIGRGTLQAQLMAYVQGTERRPCVLVGASGSGKSAALASFVRSHQLAATEAVVLEHFVGAAPLSTGLRELLRRLCAMLQTAFSITDELPLDTVKLQSHFRDLLGKIPTERRVVVVIDALNQLDETDRAHQMDWLPQQLAPNVRIVVSCITTPGQPEVVLDALTQRGVVRIDVPALSDDERRAIVQAIPSLSAKALDATQIDLLLTNPATDNPLFLLVALEELRGSGSFEEIDATIIRFPHPPQTTPRWHAWWTSLRANLVQQVQASGTPAEQARWQIRLERIERMEPLLRAIQPSEDPVTAIFTQVINRLAKDFDATTAERILTLLACARRGLSEGELRALLEEVPGHGDLFPILRQLRPYLLARGELLDFYHRNLFKAVRARYLDTAAARGLGHERLAKFFGAQDYFRESLDEQRARAKRLPPTPRPVNIRKVDELPWQLLHVAKNLGGSDPTSQHWNAVADLFTDLHFLEAKAEAVA